MTALPPREGTIEVRVGAYAVAGEGTIATLGLGSCVAIVLHDADARIGGLAHVLLPDTRYARDTSNPAKFPGTIVPIMLDDMRRRGADPARVRARLVGGASMFGPLLATDGVNIGERNVVAAREALARAGVPIAGEDTGADHGRSVYLRVEDGRLEVRSLRRGTRVL